MSARIFNSLMKSLEEAGGILRGEITDYRSFTIERPSRKGPQSALAIFIGSDDELINGKIYNVQILSTGSITVKDESGETTICDKEDFLPVKFDPKVERRIKQMVRIDV